jgi:hypothetical protein
MWAKQTLNFLNRYGFLTYAQYERDIQDIHEHMDILHDATTELVDDVLDILKDILKREKEMALNVDFITEQVARMPAVLEGTKKLLGDLHAEIESLKGQMQDPADQAKIDELANSVRDNIDNWAAAVAVNTDAHGEVPADNPVVNVPVDPAPVVVEPDPVVEAPVEAPVVEAPVEAPVVVEEPVVDAPVVDAPVVEDAPVADAPVADAPVTE